MSQAPNIPALSTKVDPEVKKAFTALKTWFDRAGNVLTASDLAATGLFSVNANGTISTNAPFLDRTIPPKITGFAATGAFASITLTWDDPRFANLAYVEVYRATEDDLAKAVRVGTTQSTMYADRPPQSSLSVTYYYWVRIVSAANVVGPYNSTAGTSGSTANDPAYVLEVLSGQIKEGQLYGDLASRIDLIDTPNTGLVDSVNDLSTMQLETIPAQYNDLFLALQREKNISDATVHIDPVTGVISLLATANVTTDIEARITDLEFSLDAEEGKFSVLNQLAVFDRVSLTEFNTQISSLQGQISLKASTSYVDGAMLGVGDILSPETANSLAGDTPFAIMNLLLLGNRMNLESLQHKANIAQAQFDLKANADAISAEAESRLLLAARVDGNASAITQINTVTAESGSANARALASLQTVLADPTTGLASKASVVQLQTANSTLLTSVAQAVMQTSTTLNGETTTVETLAQSLDGVNGEYTIKVEAGNVVAGIGLINGPKGSEFGVRAGKFFVVDPAAPLAQVLPFIVSGGKVIMDTALIGTATIKTGMVESLSADKLTVPGTGNIWEAIINTGKITNAFIGDLIQSTIYAPGATGWSINKNGTVEFNGGTFRGAVVFGTGSSGYNNLSDKPDLSGLATVSGWMKPATTLIDGNKIFTGDAYVDTLQIKGNAVTIPIAWFNAAKVRVSTGTSLGGLTSITMPTPGKLNVHFSAGLYVTIQPAYSLVVEMNYDVYVNGVFEETFLALAYSVDAGYSFGTSSAITYSKSVGSGNYSVEVKARIVAGSAIIDCSTRSLVLQGALR